MTLPSLVIYVGMHDGITIYFDYAVWRIRSVVASVRLCVDVHICDICVVGIAAVVWRC